MKDRDTQYRLAQKAIMACTYDSGIPGFDDNELGTFELTDLVNKCINNGKSAGSYIEEYEAEHFGSNVERAFELTSGQIGKVRGDIFETLIRAILWNAGLALSDTYSGSINGCISKIIDRNKKSQRYAAITLGDNYDLKQLFTPVAGKEFQKFEKHLEKRDTSYCYSTPDLIVVKCNKNNMEYFSDPIQTLSIENQDKLANIRTKIEGTIEPSDVVMAAGIKTSIRSDRMYQLLFEANAWKGIWRTIYEIEPSKYYSLIGQSYGADPKKLNSVEFTSLNKGRDTSKAIDGLIHIQTPADLISWYAESLLN